MDGNQRKIENKWGQNLKREKEKDQSKRRRIS